MRQAATAAVGVVLAHHHHEQQKDHGDREQGREEGDPVDGLGVLFIVVAGQDAAFFLGLHQGIEILIKCRKI